MLYTLNLHSLYVNYIPIKQGGGVEPSLRLLGFTLFFPIFQNLIKKFLSTVLFSW